jgi:nucleotide sugar dehydrogenase
MSLSLVDGMDRNPSVTGFGDKPIEASSRNVPFMQELPLPPEAKIERNSMDSDSAPAGANLARAVHCQPVVAVVGVGYVGSRLVEAFAKAYSVVAFDISKQRAEEVARRFKGLSVRSTWRAADLAGAEVFLISVPTSLNQDKTINTTSLEKAVQSIAEHARHGSTVVMESSVAVGMTRKLLGPLVATKKAKVGMSPEVSIFAPFRPSRADTRYQRVDPGRQFPAFQSIPKIISGIEPSSLDAVQLLYGRVFDHLVPVSSLEVAEMTKLYENCQRMVCAAYANEMADACASLGIDGWEVSRAAASKPFGYLPFQPGPGVGGDCIPVNPYYLLKTCDMPILQQATESSWRRPSEIARRMAQALERKRGVTGGRQRISASRNTRVLVVGVAFKRNQNALYNSPGVAVIHSLLRDHHLDVEFADPLVDQTAISYVPRLDTPVNWNKEHLEKFDGILVAMDQVGLDMDLLGLLDGVVIHDYSPRLR